jgi:hypothetical protein
VGRGEAEPVQLAHQPQLHHAEAEADDGGPVAQVDRLELAALRAVRVRGVVVVRPRVVVVGRRVVVVGR